MSSRSLLALALALTACGARPLPIDEPVPATDGDPSSYVPAPSAAPHTGEPVGIVLSGGDELARQVLVAVVLAMRDGDEAGIARLLAGRVGHASGTGALRTTWPRATLAHQLAVSAAASHVDLDAPFESLVEDGTVRVVPAAEHFTDATRPEVVDPSDLVVLFTPTALGRRALSGLATGVLVVRPGPEPTIVAR